MLQSGWLILICVNIIEEIFSKSQSGTCLRTGVLSILGYTAGKWHIGLDVVRTDISFLLKIKDSPSVLSISDMMDMMQFD